MGARGPLNPWIWSWMLTLRWRRGRWPRRVLRVPGLAVLMLCRWQLPRPMPLLRCWLQLRCRLPLQQLRLLQLLRPQLR